MSRMFSSPVSLRFVILYFFDSGIKLLSSPSLTFREMVGVTEPSSANVVATPATHIIAISKKRILDKSVLIIFLLLNILTVWN